MIDVLLNNETGFAFPESRLLDVVRTILVDHGVRRGEVSLAVIDDVTMHRLNREHLQHDYPTDVLSFVLDQNEEELEGEVIVSSDTARSIAPEFGWTAAEELLLYFIHGTLHLVGYDDHTDDDRAEMREREVHYLQLADITTPANHATRMLQQGEAST